MASGDTFTQFGSTSCPDSFSKEYEGYLMAQASSQTISTAVCVSQQITLTPGSENSPNHNGNLWYFTEVNCESLPCPPYNPAPNTQPEIACAQCTSSNTAKTGTVYTRWGRNSCPASMNGATSTLLYAGYAASNHHTHGGGHHPLCLHPEPTWTHTTNLASGPGARNLLYGMEYYLSGTLSQDFIDLHHI